MAKELPPEHPVFPYEEQYDVAAWHSTIRSLSLLWTDPYIHTEVTHIPKVIHNLAETAFKDPAEVVTVLEVAADNSWRKDCYPADLLNIGMLVKNKNQRTRMKTPFLLNDAYTLMHDLYYTNNRAINKEMSDDAHIERFEDDIDTLANYNRQRLNKAIIHAYCLSDTIRTAQHDNRFYLGQWDGDRSLGVSDY
jgi:hypothetical protein